MTQTQSNTPSPTPAVRHHVLTNEQIEGIKNGLLGLLGRVKRPGMARVLRFLQQETAFFYTPSSITGRHHNWRGGLAQHALETYVFLHGTVASKTYDEETLILCAVLHDICKADHYRWSRSRQRWVLRRRPGRHGMRSVQILRDVCRLEMKPVEVLAICNHMHKQPHDHYFQTGQLSQDDSALCRALVEADRRSAARSSLGGAGLEDFLIMTE